MKDSRRGRALSPAAAQTQPPPRAAESPPVQVLRRRMQNTATLKIEAPINDPDGMTTSNRAHFIRGHFSNAAVLFEHIRRGMPPTVPGPLSGEDTLSAVAFLHIRNGLPADSAALQGSDLAGLVLPGADPIASDFPGAPETP